jgi:hypothetical protein
MENYIMRAHILPSFAEQEGPKEAAFQLMFSDKPVKEG